MPVGWRQPWPGCRPKASPLSPACLHLNWWGPTATRSSGVREKTIAAVGLERFEQAIAAGYNEWRLPFLFEPIFFDVLADPKVLALIDAVLGPASIMRFFNVMITPPETSEATARLTNQFHQNFKVPVNAGQGTPVFVEITFPLTRPAQRFKLCASQPIWRGPRLTSNGMSATPW
jgi:hypothetical protein